jgi:hypothetical protein
MRERCKIDGREIHATLKNEPAFDNTVSEHTNENGVNVIDQSRPKLVTLSLEGVVSDLEVTGSAQAFHAFMVGLRSKPRAVSVETPRTTFDAMLLKSYRPKAESRYAGALHFTAEFIEFSTTALARETIKVTQKKEVKKGKVDSQEAPKPVRSALIGIGTAIVPASESAPYKLPNGTVKGR